MGPYRPSGLMGPCCSPGQVALWGQTAGVGCVPPSHGLISVVFSEMKHSPSTWDSSIFKVSQALAPAHMRFTRRSEGPRLILKWLGYT